MACTFSTAQLLKALRSGGVLYILTSRCASPHNGVQFFISHLAKWLRTRRFSEPTFRPPRAKNHWKNAMNREFLTFSHTCIFFVVTFSSLLFSLLGFSSLTLPTSAVPSVHIVGSLTSKLPSAKKSSYHHFVPRNRHFLQGNPHAVYSHCTLKILMSHREIIISYRPIIISLSIAFRLQSKSPYDFQIDFFEIGKGKYQHLVHVFWNLLFDFACFRGGFSF